MKILMIIERYLPVWGGAEIQLSQLIPHLEKRGCAIHVVTRQWHRHLPKREFIGGIEVVRLGIPGAGVVSTIIFIFSLVIHIIRNNKGIDVLHSHGAVKMGALCAALSKFLGLKNVAKIATADRVTRLTNSFSGGIVLSIFKKSAAIISMTDEIDAELADIKTPYKIIHRITNGVDCDRFKPAARGERERWRLERSMTEDTPVILFSSRLVPRKGLDTLLAAWPEISNNYPESHLVIVGSGNDQPDSVEEEMKEYVVTRQLKHVVFAGETKEPEVVLGIADIFVFPSRREGFPNALMEALASGLAVVASRIGGVCALLKDRDIGLVFDPEDSVALTKKILSLLEDDGFARNMGERARRLMLTEYSFESIADQYYDLYSRLEKTGFSKE